MTKAKGKHIEAVKRNDVGVLDVAKIEIVKIYTYILLLYFHSPSEYTCATLCLFMQAHLSICSMLIICYTLFPGMLSPPFLPSFRF